MPHIAYKPQDAAGPEALVAPIRARRGGTLLNIDLMLLHSEPLVQGWGAYLGALRRDIAVPYALRELAICAVAALTDCRYELHHHRPEFLKAGGREIQFELLASGVNSALRTGEVFNESERAVLSLVLEITERGRGCETTLAAVRAALDDDTQVVELVALISAYNMVARFINTLDIQPEQRD